MLYRVKQEGAHPPGVLRLHARGQHGGTATERVETGGNVDT